MNDREKNFTQNNRQNRGLLGAGWRPLYRQLDLEYLVHLASNDPVELAQKTLDAASDIADAMGRHQYSWLLVIGYWLLVTG